MFANLDIQAQEYPKHYLKAGQTAGPTKEKRLGENRTNIRWSCLQQHLLGLQI